MTVVLQEYVAGGDFRTLLNNTGVLHNRHARFYAAEMFAAVDALHKLGYIHRDLKPENFLIDSTGHIKLTDFGLSAGMLSPAKLESMKLKLDQVKDMQIVERSTLERRKAYKTMRENDINYVSYSKAYHGLILTYTKGKLYCRLSRLHGA